MYHTWESKEYYNIIIYIRKHTDKIKIIGIDPLNNYSDISMFDTIKKHISQFFDNNKSNSNQNCVYFLWTHNDHISTNKYNESMKKYTKTSNINSYYCGKFLKDYLGDKYCIILSNSSSGKIRFNSVCIGDNCDIRLWTLNYFYSSFDNNDNQKDNKKNIVIYDKDTCVLKKFICFSNSYYINLKNGINGGYSTKYNNYNFIIYIQKSNPATEYK